jgi:hypothetical protein
MTLMDFYRWCEQTFIGVWLQTSTYPFPVIEAVHLMAITLLLGTVYTLNFRVLGFVLKSRPLPEVAQGLKPWIWAGYAATFLTGVPLFMSEAIKLSGISVWVPKMMVMVGSILIQFIISAVLLKGGRAQTASSIAKFLAVVSTAGFWYTGYLARWIAFV